ncbi:hypothetical protein [Amycolatopsis sp. cg9]|uniref:hypothetical protein n=1 Tax=Amycolatopsis sp. cg9 TaxID=3238801 RepID=UPI00352578E0
MWLVGVLVVVILVAAFVPLFYDLIKAVKWRKELTDWLTSGKILRREDLLAVLRLIARPRGTVNAARTTIAYLIVALVAAALGVTVFSAADDAPDLRKTIVASVLTVLSLVIGFYFGSRTAQTAIEAQNTPGAGPAGPGGVPPVVTGVDPDSASSGAVTVTGTGLADATILFGTLPATPIGPPGKTQAVVAVPVWPAGYPLLVHVVAETAAGTSERTDKTKFTYSPTVSSSSAVVGH